jgi:hypothetical protein
LRFISRAYKIRLFRHPLEDIWNAERQKRETEVDKELSPARVQELAKE